MESDLDTRIVEALTADARQSVSAIASHLGVARTTVQERIARLERRGVIAGYTVRPGPAAVGRRVSAHVAITVDPKRQRNVLQTLRAFDEVRTLHTVSGPFDVIAIVAADSTAAVDDVLDRIGEVAGIERTTSAIVLSTKLDRW